MALSRSPPTELAMHTADLDILRASSDIESWASDQEVVS